MGTLVALRDLRTTELLQESVDTLSSHGAGRHRGQNSPLYVLPRRRSHGPTRRDDFLCTVRVLAAMLDDGNAFVRMLHEIERTEPADYDTLIGRSFTDNIELGFGSEQSEKEK
ncbi:hypothetical protein SBC2_06130 [Caballeronia sp. SBC2]|nr:hypothetical protein SBC2_06130 [Caballeronia sp. SBC2]